MNFAKARQTVWLLGRGWRAFWEVMDAPFYQNRVYAVKGIAHRFVILSDGYGYHAVAQCGVRIAKHPDKLRKLVRYVKKRMSPVGTPVTCFECASFSV